MKNLLRLIVPSALIVVGLVYYAWAQVIQSPGVTGIGCAYNTVPPTLTNGQAGWVQCSSTGGLVVSGGSGATVTATAADPTYVEGSTNNPLSADLSGHLRVVATGLAQGSTTAGQSGSLVLGAVTTAAPAYTTAQTSPVSLTTTGETRVVPSYAGVAEVADPCMTVAATYTPISITSATTTRIIAPTASKKTYICHIFMVSAIANNIGIVEGTGGTCGAGTAGVVGGTTAANGVNL